MEKIAELLYEAYDQAHVKSLYSESYENVYSELRTLYGDNFQKLAEFEHQFLETIRLSNIEVISFILNLLNPQYE